MLALGRDSDSSASSHGSEERAVIVASTWENAPSSPVPECMNVEHSLSKSQSLSSGVVDYSARLSVIVPCYNEAPTVVELLRRVRLALPESQIIVVDDGSTDHSDELIRSVTDSLELQVVYRKQNCGIGAAFRAGQELADRDYVIIQDADLQYDPNDILHHRHND